MFIIIYTTIMKSKKWTKNTLYIQWYLISRLPNSPSNWYQKIPQWHCINQRHKSFTHWNLQKSPRSTFRLKKPSIHIQSIFSKLEFHKTLFLVHFPIILTLSWVILGIYCQYKAVRLLFFSKKPHNTSLYSNQGWSTNWFLHIRVTAQKWIRTMKDAMWKWFLNLKNQPSTIKYIRDMKNTPITKTSTKSQETYRRCRFYIEQEKDGATTRTKGEFFIDLFIFHIPLFSDFPCHLFFKIMTPCTYRLVFKMWNVFVYLGCEHILHCAHMVNVMLPPHISYVRI